MQYFNPRSREGSDDIQKLFADVQGISIRAPARGATPFITFSGVKMGFQSALPRGERLEPYAEAYKLEIFQSALPRGERLHIPVQYSVHLVISIRAPARGATCAIHENVHKTIISIRAPARGATLPPFPHSRPYVISIRAPARGATRILTGRKQFKRISIRAPARGATRFVAT